MKYVELYTCLLEVANLMNQRPIGRITNDPDDGLYLSQRHASWTNHLNGATKTVQRNQEPTAYSRIRTEESGHLLETLDPRRVPVVGPQKDVECWKAHCESGWQSHHGRFQLCAGPSEESSMSTWERMAEFEMKKSRHQSRSIKGLSQRLWSFTQQNDMRTDVV